MQTVSTCSKRVSCEIDRTVVTSKLLLVITMQIEDHVVVVLSDLLIPNVQLFEIDATVRKTQRGSPSRKILACRRTRHFSADFLKRRGGVFANQIDIKNPSHVALALDTTKSSIEFIVSFFRSKTARRCSRPSSQRVPATDFVQPMSAMECPL